MDLVGSCKILHGFTTSKQDHFDLKKTRILSQSPTKKANRPDCLNDTEPP